MRVEPFADFGRPIGAVWNSGRSPIGPYVPADTYRSIHPHVVAPFGCPPGPDLRQRGWLLGKRRQCFGLLRCGHEPTFENDKARPLPVRIVE